MRGDRFHRGEAHGHAIFALVYGSVERLVVAEVTGQQVVRFIAMHTEQRHAVALTLDRGHVLQVRRHVVNLLAAQFHSQFGDGR